MLPDVDDPGYRETDRDISPQDLSAKTLEDFHFESRTDSLLPQADGIDHPHSVFKGWFRPCCVVPILLLPIRNFLKRQAREAPEPVVGGRRQDHGATGSQDPVKFRHRDTVFFQVLENSQAGYQIEHSITEWKGLDIRLEETAEDSAVGTSVSPADLFQDGQGEIRADRPTAPPLQFRQKEPGTNSHIESQSVPPQSVIFQDSQNDLSSVLRPTAEIFSFPVLSMPEPK